LIDDKEYRSLVYVVPGAFVKEPMEQIINDGSLLIDLDAQSMYPSMIAQHNISFDTLLGYIIDPYHNKFIDVLSTIIDETNEDIKLNKKIELFQTINTMIESFIEKDDGQNKLDTGRNLYYIITHLLNRLVHSCIPLNTIFSPKGDVHYELLKFYFLDVIEILNRIHPNKDIYNLFIYRYLFDEEKLKNIKNIYIVENIFDSNTRIVTLNIEEAVKYISNYTITINGCLYSKHSDKLGIMFEFLEEFGMKRKEFRKLRDQYSESSTEYKYYDNRQNAIKIVLNSAYGVSGLSGFKYSNYLIASSITASGRLTSKLAQYITETALKGEKIG
jgi:DNA polymerase elongation subunit (family B)